MVDGSLFGSSARFVSPHSGLYAAEPTAAGRQHARAFLPRPGGGVYTASSRPPVVSVLRLSGKLLYGPASCLAVNDSDRFSDHILKLRTQKPVEGYVYYAVGLFGREDGGMTTTCQTSWVGFADERRQREIRKACPVLPEKALSVLESIGEPGVLVNDETDFYVFCLIGGHGVIEQSICEKHLPHVVGENEIVNSVADGMVGVEQAPPGWLRRAPSKKKRMEILRRDGQKCKICGRSPHNYVDLELHVHHIRPWGKGGLTESDNLVTLCQTCHDGLDPHHDPALFQQLGYDPYAYLFKARPDYKAGVLRYRESIQQGLESLR